MAIQKRLSEVKLHYVTICETCVLHDGQLPCIAQWRVVWQGMEHSLQDNFHLNIKILLNSVCLQIYKLLLFLRSSDKNVHILCKINTLEAASMKLWLRCSVRMEHQLLCLWQNHCYLVRNWWLNKYFALFNIKSCKNCFLTQVFYYKLQAFLL